MAKSYRRPYSGVTGLSSAKEDKRRAARGMRRRQNQWLRSLKDYEESFIPHRLECAYNNVWKWDRDGKQLLRLPTKYERSEYERTQLGLFRSEWDELRMKEHHPVWPPAWYQKLTRK